MNTVIVGLLVGLLVGLIVGIYIGYKVYPMRHLKKIQQDFFNHGIQWMREEYGSAMTAFVESKKKLEMEMRVIEYETKKERIALKKAKKQSEASLSAFYTLVESFFGDLAGVSGLEKGKVVRIMVQDKPIVVIDSESIIISDKAKSIIASQLGLSTTPTATKQQQGLGSSVIRSTSSMSDEELMDMANIR